jgi:hypothetical protein
VRYFRRYSDESIPSDQISSPKLAPSPERPGGTVVLRYRYELEARRLAHATVNLRLAAVRRLAYEAADNGLLSPDLSASIRRVKGAKKLGTRIGNWLTCARAQASRRSRQG